MMCGLPGSGKTTVARELERSMPGLRLCPDEWIESLLALPHDIAERDRLRTPVEAIQWETAKRALTLGANVILENGFWSRKERSRYRCEAEALGARVEICYLNVELEKLWARVSARNASLPAGTFAVSRAELEEWWALFEPPDEDELRGGSERESSV